MIEICCGQSVEVLSYIIIYYYPLAVIMTHLW